MADNNSKVGIRVTIVEPGVFRTDFNGGLLQYLNNKSTTMPPPVVSFSSGLRRQTANSLALQIRRLKP